MKLTKKQQEAIIRDDMEYIIDSTGLNALQVIAIAEKFKVVFVKIEEGETK